MTQLEEYKERRKLLHDRINECRRIACDKNATADERQENRWRRKQYQTLLNELEIQLQAFDPEYRAMKHIRQR